MSYSKARFESINQMTPEVKQFQFHLEDDKWDFRPGQHTHIRYENEQGEEVVRPYTPVTLPDRGDYFCLAIKRYDSGTASVWMHNCDIGEELEVEEPDGNLYIHDYEKDIVLVSSGTGATPMYAMLRDYLQNGEGKVYYFHGEKTQETLMFQESLDQLEAEHENLEVIYSLSDESWKGPEGYIQKHIPETLESLEEKDFYICGVPGMVVDTQNLLRDHGVEEENIITEGWEKDAVSE